MAKKLNVGSEKQNMSLLEKVKEDWANKAKANTNTNNVSSTPVDTPVVDTKKTSNLPGINDDLYNDMFNTPFNESDDVKNARNESKDALSGYKNLANQKNIISQSTMNSINSSFVVPNEVREADRYLAEQLSKIQSGKTSYSDQVKEMMDKIMNRDKFSYDVDTDPLFQQALASAMNSGKQAMQDTMGQASALTGGYGSTYATSAANQAYNAFIVDAYDNLPQYYQMALEAYQLESEDMYRQFGMLSELDDKEFNRTLSAYDATYTHRNQMWNEAYTMHRDSVNDAFAMANLELNEYGQRVNNAYNLYAATSDYADKLYEREYNKWSDSINMAWKEGEMINKDYWDSKNFDEGVRQFEQNYAQNEDHFTRNQEFQSSESQKQRDWQSLEAEKDRNFTASENAKNRAVTLSKQQTQQKQKESKLTKADIEGIQKSYRESGGGQKGFDAVTDYLELIGKTADSSYIDTIIASAAAEKGLPSYYQTWSISDDTKNWNNPFSSGNEDMNDKYTNLNGETKTYKELKKAVNSSNLSKEEKDEFLKNLKKQSKN